MIRAMLYRRDSGVMTTGGEELLAQWDRHSGALLWADFAENAPEPEMGALAARFGLHPLAIQDAQRQRHQPKLECLPDHVFVLLKGLGPESDEFEFETHRRSPCFR